MVGEVRVRRGGPQATSWLPVQPVAGGPVFPAVCSKLPHEGACWNRPARLHCSQPESKPIWAEKSNLFSFSCQKDMHCLVNFSSSSIFFSVSFSFFSSKLFQVCRGRVVFCGGKVPCWRVWCKPGEFGASWKVGGGGLVQTRLRPSSLTRQGCIVLVQASLRLSCCLPEQSVKLQHHSCHCSYHS